MPKGQAAMEFMMTYSWAILVVVALTAVLVYFNPVSNLRFLPESCKMPQGFHCQVSGSSIGVEMFIENGASFTITNVTIQIVGSGCDANFTGPNQIAPKGSGIFAANCTDESGKYEHDLVVSYYKQNSPLLHTAPGYFLAKKP